MRLSGKTALITNGCGGLGMATARLFVAEGARVIILGRDAEKLEDASREIGGNTLFESVDICDSRAMKVAISRVASKIGGLDIVFANEDTGGLTPLGCADLNVFETIIRTNLTSVFFALQAALPHLRDGGSVVLNSSAHAVVGAPGYSAYAASKAGVRAMTRVLTSELSHRNIRVNVLTPAAATTPIWDRRAPGVASCEALERRIADADEAARSVLFLASDESSLIKAAEIVIGGRPTEYGQSASTADPA